MGRRDRGARLRNRVVDQAAFQGIGGYFAERYSSPRDHRLAKTFRSGDCQWRLRQEIRESFSGRRQVSGPLVHRVSRLPCRRTRPIMPPEYSAPRACVRRYVPLELRHPSKTDSHASGERFSLVSATRRGTSSRSARSAATSPEMSRTTGPEIPWCVKRRSPTRPVLEWPRRSIRTRAPGMPMPEHRRGQVSFVMRGQGPGGVRRWCVPPIEPAGSPIRWNPGLHNSGLRWQE